VARTASNPTKRLEKAAEDRIGDYRVIDRVGSGGMATVWRVKGPGGKVHALKEMRPQAEAKREMTRRFKQEFEVTARLSHRNIVGVRDFFAAQDTFHIVMEWVDGPDLRDVVRYAGVFDAGRLALVGAQIASGLAAAHAEGILHRDLKPENVLVNKRGQIKVTDFGVARVTGTRLTATGIIVGSPAYMSPEQLAGVSGQKLGTAADVYSFGVMLYELGEGRDPLGLRKHEDLLTVLRTKREKRPKAMRQIKHPGLEELILSYLEPNAEDRPQDMERIARDLRRIARSEGAQRADIEYLVGTALANRSEKKKAKGVAAPQRPPSPNLADLGRPSSEAKPAKRAKKSVKETPPWEEAKPAGKSEVKPARRVKKESVEERPKKSRAPRRRPPVPTRKALIDPVDPRIEMDFGSGSRRLSIADQLSVKRRAASGEGIGLMSWAVVILFGAAVVFFGASASLTGSPLGLLEVLVPLP
jgi:serine/threonine protein kinase